MAARSYPFDPPINPNLPCQFCGDPLVALAQIVDGSFGIAGLGEYEWAHVSGEKVCRPTTLAKPYDAWRATTAVESAVNARHAAEDALAAALEND